MNCLFADLTMDEQLDTNGGAVAGAVIGACFGSLAGVVIWAAAFKDGGNKSLWKCWTSGALAGTAIGLYTPV